MMTILNIHLGDYNGFVSGQARSKCLSREVWTDLLEFRDWVNMDPETFEGILVFLAIKYLGNIHFANLVPQDCPSKWEVVRALLQERTNIVPSVLNLSPSMKQRLRQV